MAQTLINQMVDISICSNRFVVLGNFTKKKDGAIRFKRHISDEFSEEKVHIKLNGKRNKERNIYCSGD
jgi:hypothetical protein